MAKPTRLLRSVAFKPAGASLGGAILCSLLLLALHHKRGAYERSATAQSGIPAHTSAPPAPPPPLLSLSEIENLYARHKVSEAYLAKWQDGRQLDAALDRLARDGYDPRGKDAPRAFTLLDFQEWVRKHGISSAKKMLATDTADPELRYVDAAETIEYRYEGAAATTPTPTSDSPGGACGIRDLHCLGLEPSLFAETDFDMAVISQTLEHLYDPLLAMRNVLQVMRPGGHVFASAPALNIQHMTPVHFFHYTPMGMAVLFARAGFEIVEMGQFGNRDYERLLLGQHRWPDVYELQVLGNGTVNNERDNPDQVWILARKPGG